jgi:multidrug efflux pump subunit AcrA (membrane-fusion protein)
MLRGPNVNIWPLTITWLAEDGSEVETGDVIVQFDPSQLADNLESLERKLLDARSRLETTRAASNSEVLAAGFDLKKAQIDLRKAELDARIPVSLLSTQEYDAFQVARSQAELSHREAARALRARRNSAAAALAEQEVLLSQAVTALERARVGMDLLTLRAPRPGVIVRREHPRHGRAIRAGDLIFPGISIVSLPDISSMVVEAHLFDVDDGQIDEGMEVTAIVDAFPDRPMRGTVAKIDNIAGQMSPHSRRRTFRTIVKVAGLDAEHMRPGMSVKVIVRNSFENQLLIPRTSLVWETGDSQAAVKVQTLEGTWLTLSLGSCNVEVCIVRKGIEEGTLVGNARPEPGGGA